MIQANKPTAQRRSGRSGRAFLALPGIAALRSSRTLLQNELRRAAESSTGEMLRITTVGAAPAAELRGLLAARTSGVEATLIEFDDEALAWMRTAQRASRLRLELESSSISRSDIGGWRLKVRICLFAAAFCLLGPLRHRAAQLLAWTAAPGGWPCRVPAPAQSDKTFFAHILGWDIEHRDENDNQHSFPALRLWQRLRTV